MPGRYTDAQRQQIMANRKARDAGLWYGYDLNDQGYKNAKEQGQAAFSQYGSKAAFGTFSDPTWDQRVVNGVVQRRAKAENPERVAETGGKWFDAPDFVQRGYQNSRGVESYGTGADAWQSYIMNKANQQRVANGQVKQGPDGNYYYASGQGFDAGGHRISDDKLNNPALAAQLFGNQPANNGAPAPAAPAPAPAAPAAPPATPVDLSHIVQQSPTLGQTNNFNTQGSNFGQQQTNPFSNGQGIVPQQNSDLMTDPFGLKKRKGLPGAPAAGTSLGSDF